MDWRRKTSARDGNLRQLFSSHLREAWWIPVETWSTGQGVPDTYYIFPGGICGWVEFKSTSGWVISSLTPGQVAWHERYSRQGGRCFVAIRRKVPAGPRRESADQLWLFPGSASRILHQGGLLAPQGELLAQFDGGPGRWAWDTVRTHLCAQPLGRSPLNPK